MIGKTRSIYFAAACCFLIIFPEFTKAAPLNVTFLNKPVKNIVLDLIKFLLSIAGGIALLFLIVSGIYFMMSGGSSSGRETAKKMLKSALVGILLVIISYAIMVLLDNIFAKP